MPRHAALFFAVALSGAFLDLWTKHAVFAHFEARPWPREVEILPGFLSYGKTYNPGVVFGIAQKYPAFWKGVAVLAVPAILAIFFSVKRLRWILTLSLGMILAGTIGNMYDRLAHGAVRDFLKFYVVSDGQQKVWPLFNLADSYICVGVFLLTVEMMFFEEKKAKPAPAPAPLAPPPPAAVPPPAPLP
ncbi:MAG TPA: signal peptidase II [Planctomycetota bacterium]